MLFLEVEGCILTFLPWLCRLNTKSITHEDEEDLETANVGLWTWFVSSSLVELWATRAEK